MAWIYAVASAKGGVGKTTTTANLGAALAAAGHDVAVVDADLAMPNLAAALGVDVSDATVHDVLAGRASVDDATYRSDAGVDVVPGDGSLDAFAAAEPTELRAVFSALEPYDFVLVDTGSGLSHDAVLPLGLADAVFLVCNTERDALGDTDKTREVTERLGGTVAGVVLTRVDPENPNAEEVAERLDAAVVEAVPADDAVAESVASSVPVSTHAPDSPAAVAYATLAEAVAAYDPDAEVDDGVEVRTDEIDESSETGSVVTGSEATESGDTESEATESGDTESKTAESTNTEPDEGESADAADGTLSIASAEAKLGVDEGESGEVGRGATEEAAEDDTAESNVEPLADAIAEAEEPTDTAEGSESDRPDAAGGSEEEEEDGVYDTALVEEAENAESESGGSGDEQPHDDGETTQANGNEEDEEADTEQKGFLGRLLR
ncbi:MinD/ParA family ATP-binding protein [Haloprofundus halophilus]|uniref:MinD/ParA family ATP-binding protein n=1 Tax=Haloprofundus halophilus TaxID=2283527 RepID=UPI000E44B1AD|nr:MinD/ParA family protein [Haloprofundus halophilus]